MNSAEERKSPAGAGQKHQKCNVENYAKVVENFEGAKKNGRKIPPQVIGMPPRVLIHEAISKGDDMLHGQWNTTTTPVPEFTSKRSGIFEVNTSSGWLERASKLPQPKMLFDCLWYQGEICYLFSDSNTGKSALAVQVANSIASGISISGFQLEAQPQPVIYLDFELSSVQFRNRYHDDAYGDHDFSNNFYRLEVSRDADLDTGEPFAELVIEGIESASLDTGAKVVIIDNLTFVLTNAQEGKEAGPFMKRLKEVKDRLGLSLLIIAHTPKRFIRTPIDQNTMAGSKALLNFADSAFALAYGNTPKGRYIKQVKARSSEIIYHAGNVPVLTLDKHGCALSFNFEGYSTEDEQLFDGDEEARMIALVKDLSQQGKSVRDIEKETGISRSKVQRLLKK